MSRAGLQKKLAALADSTEFEGERQAALAALEKVANESGSKRPSHAPPPTRPTLMLSIQRDSERAWPYELAKKLARVFGVDVVGDSESFGIVDDAQGKGWAAARVHRELREKLAPRSRAYREGFLGALDRAAHPDDAQRLVGSHDALKFLASKL